MEMERQTKLKTKTEKKNKKNWIKKFENENRITSKLHWQLVRM